MEPEVIELYEEIERLLQNEDLDWEDPGRECLRNLLFLIRDSIRCSKAISYLTDIGPRLPFDVVLKLNEISGWDPIEKIENEWGVPGFNDWYKETHGITVEDVSK